MWQTLNQKRFQCSISVAESNSKKEWNLSCPFLSNRKTLSVQFLFIHKIVISVEFLQLRTPHHFNSIVCHSRLLLHLPIVPFSSWAHVSGSECRFPFGNSEIALLFFCGMEKGSYLCFTNYSSLVTLLWIDRFRHIINSDTFSFLTSKISCWIISSVLSISRCRRIVTV